MSHANAPLTPAGRLRLIERCPDRSIAHVAAEAGVSRACLSKWKNCYEALGEVGLLDRSSAPHRSPTQTPQQVVDLTETWRRDLDPDGSSNRVTGKITARFPGHMVHLDVKKVGGIPDGGGWRAHGRGSAQDRAAAAWPAPSTYPTNVP